MTEKPNTPSAAKAKSETQTPPPNPNVPLKAICAELKIDPRLAREKLRIASRDLKKFPELAKAHKSRGAWEWPKGSMAEKEARAVISS